MRALVAAVLALALLVAVAAPHVHAASATARRARCASLRHTDDAASAETPDVAPAVARRRRGRPRARAPARHRRAARRHPRSVASRGRVAPAAAAGLRPISRAVRAPRRAPRCAPCVHVAWRACSPQSCCSRSTRSPRASAPPSARPASLAAAQPASAPAPAPAAGRGGPEEARGADREGARRSARGRRPGRAGARRAARRRAGDDRGEPHGAGSSSSPTSARSGASPRAYDAYDVAALLAARGAVRPAGQGRSRCSRSWSSGSRRSSTRTLRADVFISFTPDGVDVEEAYLTTLSLPAGLQVRAGKLFSPFGRLNQQHPHVWELRGRAARPRPAPRRRGARRPRGGRRLARAAALVRRAAPRRPGHRAGREDDPEQPHRRGAAPPVLLPRRGDDARRGPLGRAAQRGDGGRSGTSAGVDVYLRWRPLAGPVLPRAAGRALRAAVPERRRAARTPAATRSCSGGRARTTGSACATTTRRRRWQAGAGEGAAATASLGAWFPSEFQRLQAPGLPRRAPGRRRRARGDPRARVRHRRPRRPPVLAMTTLHEEPHAMRAPALRAFALAALACLAAVLAVPSRAAAAVKVVTTTEGLAALAREVGGDDVQVESLSRGVQDPHFVDANPMLAVKLRNADLLVDVGLDLEIGWLPPLVTQSRNAAIQPGGPRRLTAASAVDVLDLPTGPGEPRPGRPPPRRQPALPHRSAAGRAGRRRDRRAPLGARPAQRRALRRAPRRRSRGGSPRRSARWQARLAPLKGRKLLTRHRTMTYFLDWSGLVTAGELEPRPGVPPPPSHLADLVVRGAAGGREGHRGRELLRHEVGRGGRAPLRGEDRPDPRRRGRRAGRSTATRSTWTCSSRASPGRSSDAARRGSRTPPSATGGGRSSPASTSPWRPATSSRWSGRTAAGRRRSSARCSARCRSWRAGSCGRARCASATCRSASTWTPSGRSGWARSC